MANTVKFLSDSDQIEFTVMEDPTPEKEDIPDVEWNESVGGGNETATKYRGVKRLRGFRVLLDEVNLSEETAWDNFIAGISDYSLSFAFEDWNGDAFTARFNSIPKKVRIRGNPGYKFVDCEVVEML